MGYSHESVDGALQQSTQARLTRCAVIDWLYPLTQFALQSRFEPKILPKHERRFPGFDDKVLSLSARGMTTHDIQGHLEEIYGLEVSPS
jgi:putative transposase